jgi:hypothetical protein
MPLPPDLNDDLKLAIEAARKVQRFRRPIGVVERDGAVNVVVDVASTPNESGSRTTRARVLPFSRARTRD